MIWSTWSSKNSWATHASSNPSTPHADLQLLFSTYKYDNTETKISLEYKMYLRSNRQKITYNLIVNHLFQCDTTGGKKPIIVTEKTHTQILVLMKVHTYLWRFQAPMLFMNTSYWRQHERRKSAIIFNTFHSNSIKSIPFYCFISFLITTNNTMSLNIRFSMQRCSRILVSVSNALHIQSQTGFVEFSSA